MVKMLPYVDKGGNLSAKLDALDLTYFLGPVRQELYKVIPMTLIYCLIFLTGK